MSEPGGGLDELFSFREEPVAEEVEVVEKKKSKALWVLRNAVLVAIATTVTVAGLRASNEQASILLIASAFAALRLVLLAVAAVRAPSIPKRQADAQASSSAAGADELRLAVRRWELTLARANEDADLYSRNVLPVLAELTDERLRLRHGITRASDPRRARELLGDPLWAALHDPGRRTAKAIELETYVDALERL